jgi:hypothetical protein
MTKEEKPPKDSFTIHDLPLAERPRQRLQKFGSEALSVQELLAVILGRGIAGESVMVTAQRLLSQFDGLKGLAKASGWPRLVKSKPLLNWPTVWKATRQQIISRLSKILSMLRLW